MILAKPEHPDLQDRTSSVSFPVVLVCSTGLCDPFSHLLFVIRSEMPRMFSICQYVHKVDINKCNEK